MITPRILNSWFYLPDGKTKRSWNWLLYERTWEMERTAWSNKLNLISIKLLVFCSWNGNAITMIHDCCCRRQFQSSSDPAVVISSYITAVVSKYTPNHKYILDEEIYMSSSDLFEFISSITWSLGLFWGLREEVTEAIIAPEDLKNLFFKFCCWIVKRTNSLVHLSSGSPGAYTGYSAI